MRNSHRVAAIVLVSVFCVMSGGYGPKADTTKDAAAALEVGKRLRIKADAPEHAKQIWEHWLKDRPKRIDAARASEKDAKERLRVAKAGSVGKYAVESAKKRSRFEQTRDMYLALQEQGSDDPGMNNAFVGKHSAGFIDKAAKEKSVALIQAVYDKAKARLDGLEKGTLIDVPPLFMTYGRPKALADMKEGMVGVVSQIRVTDVDDEEFMGYVSDASEGAADRLCIFTNCDTSGLVDGTFLEDGFTVQIEGIREVSMFVGGATVNKRLFVLKACSFYEWLEEEPDRKSVPQKTK